MLKQMSNVNIGLACRLTENVDVKLKPHISSDNNYRGLLWIKPV